MTFRTLFLVSLSAATLLAAGCRTSTGRMVTQGKAQDWPVLPVDTELDPLEAPTWKECLPEAYVYLEHVGDPAELGDAMRRAFQLAQAAELPVSGPPFALFFDDPAKVSVARLRSRACLPIDPSTSVPAGFNRDELPSRMVVFQQRAGAYAEAPLVVPGLMAYLRQRGWSPDGPVREVYLVNPAETTDPSQLVCEVQVPWRQGS